MRGPDRSVWTLAGGSACVFALSIVLGRLPWQVAFAAVLASVVAWGWWARPAEGAVIGAIAWLCVTGFDVHRLGVVEVTGGGDVVRAAALLLSGVLAASVHTVLGARRRYRRTNPIWVTLREGEPGAPGRRTASERESGSPKSNAGIGRNG